MAFKGIQVVLIRKLIEKIENLRNNGGRKSIYYVTLFHSLRLRGKALSVAE